MSKYKVGDRVLIEHSICQIVHDDGYKNIEVRSKCFPHSSFWIREYDIHGPAPAPAVDWSDPALMGRRVRVRDNRRDEWSIGRFIQYLPNVMHDHHQVLTGSLISTWSECELLGEGDA